MIMLKVKTFRDDERSLQILINNWLEESKVTDIISITQSPSGYQNNCAIVVILYKS